MFSSASARRLEIGDGGLVGLVASRRYDDAVKLLDSDAQFRKHVNHVDSHGNTPINYACAMNAPQQFVHRLLACGADCTIPNARGGTPLTHAVYSKMGHEVITAIIRNGADVNHQNESGGTALQTACVCKADLKTIQAMIDLGADPLLGNANGHTPLIFAVRNRNPMETIAYLAQKIGPVGVNAQVHSGDAKYLGFTALHFAAQDLEPATCALLVKFGAKPGLPNHVGKTPLQLCMGDDNTRTAMRTAKPI